MPAKSHGPLCECVRNFLKLRNFRVFGKNEIKTVNNEIKTVKNGENY